MMQAGRTHICTFSGDMLQCIKLERGVLWIKKELLFILYYF